MPIPVNSTVLPVTRLMVRQKLAELGISQNYTDAQIDSALVSVDQDALYDEERAKISIEIWDRKSPINGIPAETILSRRKDIPANGEIYLLKEGSHVIYFQPHAPEGGMKPMTAEDVMVYAEKHAEDVASVRAVEKIINQVVTMLGV